MRGARSGEVRGEGGEACPPSRGGRVAPLDGEDEAEGDHCLLAARQLLHRLRGRAARELDADRDALVGGDARAGCRAEEGGRDAAADAALKVLGELACMDEHDEHTSWRLSCAATWRRAWRRPTARPATR